ncbi:acylphosphatase [Candidatus Parcubacteria bacterium]|nr:MAG: acylphosphatase [Candidatus Parcubacteria bacterium]
MSVSRRAIITIKGIVQGVFFRDFVKKKADELGIVGVVSNEIDGTVKIIAESKEEELRQLIDHIMRGPRGSHIEDVGVEWMASVGKFKNFEIL